MKHCLFCDGPLPAPKRPGLRGPAKYCSADCRENDRRKRPEPTCEFCSEPIPYAGRGRPKKYCDDACYLNHRKTTAR